MIFKALKGARSLASWTALAGAVSLGGWLLADHFARRSIGAWTRGGWFVVSVLVTIAAGVLAFPRWQALLGLAAVIGAIVLVIK